MEATQRGVVMEVPPLMVVQLWELSGTPGVDQEPGVGLGKGKDKGPKYLELKTGPESWKCDSCE